MSEGTKHDAKKVRYELVPWEALHEEARVWTHGGEKYGDWNWMHGFKWLRLLGAILRHTFLWSVGITYDKETGLHHLAHARCGLGMLISYDLREIGSDDRKTLPPACQRYIEDTMSGVYTGNWEDFMKEEDDGRDNDGEE